MIARTHRRPNRWAASLLALGLALAHGLFVTLPLYRVAPASVAEAATVPDVAPHCEGMVCSVRNGPGTQSPCCCVPDSPAESTGMPVLQACNQAGANTAADIGDAPRLSLASGNPVAPLRLGDTVRFAEIAGPRSHISQPSDKVPLRS